MKHAGLRTVTAGIAVVAALGTLSACGGHNGGSSADKGGKGGSPAVSSPLEALRLAAGATGKAESAKVTGSTVTSQMTMSMNGAIDWSNGMTGNMDIKMSGQGAASAAQLGVGVMKAIYMPDAMYINMGPEIAKSDGGKPWMKYSFDSSAKESGTSGAAMKSNMQNANPTIQVQMLIASGDVKSLGSATVNGEQTTHYAGTADVTKLAGQQAGLDAATVKALKAQLAQQGITTEQVDIWVDGHGLLVKSITKLTSNSGVITSTSSYSDYGVKVSATPPPASQTMDMAKMLAQQGGKA